MDYSRFFFGCDGDDHHQLPTPQPSPKKELQLQGPRPTPLRVSKDSHAIRKPPRHPPATDEDLRQPVIIYAVSPKVIHVKESNFMSLVQRLTGLSPSGPRAGDVSPAARFASIEKASPKHRPMVGLNSAVGGGNQAFTSSAVEGFDIATGRGTMLGGILSPAPSSLLAIPSGFFSPAMDSPAVPLFQDLIMSPLLQGASGFIGGSNGSIVSSPSAWFSSSMISPSPISLDLYNLFSDF